MLEGLEVSIISFSGIDHIKQRIDSEFYKKEFLWLQNKFENIGATTVKEIGAKLDCSAFYPSITGDYSFDREGIPFLRVNEIKDGLVQITDTTAFLPQHILDNNTSTIKIGYPDDIIIAKGGNTLAKLGLITDDYPYYSLSRDIILLRTHGIEDANKYFLWVLLHSKYGQSLLWRTASQTGQPHLTLPSLLDISLPKFKIAFENIFEILYKKSVELKNISKAAYSKAQAILLDTLSLTNFQPSEEGVNIKSFKDSFLDRGRLDSEYYLKKYEGYANLISNYNNGHDLLSIVCDLKDKNYTPVDTQKYRYIELSNIGKSGEINGCTIDYGKQLPSRARRKVKNGDVIISSIEGSLESCALITNEYEGALCSTGFYVIRSEHINPESLLVLFKSSAMQQLLKQACSGTILTAINKDEFLKIPIPKIDTPTQIKIKEALSESLELRSKSEALLEIAKRGVELAIEHNEEMAMDWMEKELSTNNIYLENYGS